MKQHHTFIAICVLLALGAVFSVDAGFTVRPPPSGSGNCVDGSVYLDKDRNHTKDRGEPGFCDVCVEIVSPCGRVLRNTTTNVNGNWRFDNMPAGDYTVRLCSGPTACMVGTQNSQGWAAVTVKCADVHAVNFGFSPCHTIDGYVYKDKKGDCTRGDRDEGFADVCVKLLSSPCGEQLEKTKTDDTGYFKFCNVRNGNYTVELCTAQPRCTNATENPKGSVDVTVNFTDVHKVNFGFKKERVCTHSVNGCVYAAVPVSTPPPNFRRRGDSAAADSGHGESATSSDIRFGLANVTVRLTCSRSRRGGNSGQSDDHDDEGDQDRDRRSLGRRGDSDDNNGSDNGNNNGNGWGRRPKDITMTTTTDDAGNYTFSGVPDGLRCCASVVNPPAGATPTEVPQCCSLTNTSGDVSDVCFGFRLECPRQGCPSTGKSVSYWKRQVCSFCGEAEPPLPGKRGDDKHDEEKPADHQMTDAIDAVEKLLLPEPFQFATNPNSTEKGRAACAILRNTGGTALDNLKSQLLALEFNWVFGLGYAAPCDAVHYALMAESEDAVLKSDQHSSTELQSLADQSQVINGY